MSNVTNNPPELQRPIDSRAHTTYAWSVLRAGTFKLDAGSMFGLIPRVVWSRSMQVDDRGRMQVQHNCILLQSQNHRILIESGTGDKLDDKSRDIFELERRSITDALHEAGVAPESIDAVVVSHLHFDHAGGLTRLCREGETPDWTGPASGMAGARPNHGVKRTFPNARIVAQAREWVDAIANRSVMTRTYFADHLEPLRDRLLLVDSARPFVTGATPDRDEMPTLTLEQRTSEPLPGVRVFLVPGHTWGQQAVMFNDREGRTIVFTPDVMPTAAHVGAAYSLAYDVEPYTSAVTRHWFLTEAARRDWILVLDHEPGNPVFRVRENGKGWFELVPQAIMGG
jgi:glyoxylase-like metal-dependent hydrolase (beta-lactamase superfamily II)